MTRTDDDQTQRFDALFRTYSPDMLAYCGWRSGSAAEAQDAVAEVFMTAWRRLEDVPDGDAARIWLYATARRVIANQRRSGRRRDALRDRLTGEAATHATEERPLEPEPGLVHDALDRLSAADREVLLLAEWEGLGPAQIARVLGCLAVTARGRLHRARLRFRNAYDELQAQTDGDTRRRRVAPLRASAAMTNTDDGGRR